MKKLLIFTFLMASMVFIAPAAEAKASANSVNSGSMNSSLITTQPRWRGRRTVITTRTVRAGYRTYRYTYRTTYNRFGRVVSQTVIRRVRVR
jgi:hypothetical protein